MDAVRYSARSRAAMRVAARAHRRQDRKGAPGVPYIVHPVAVAAALAQAGATEDVVCAGYLHDVVEDTKTTLDDIRAAFGDRVAELVDAVTEPKRDEHGNRIPWRARKEGRLAHLRSTDDGDVHALKGADLLVNATDLLLDLDDRGDAVWERFRAGREEQLWYYRSVGEVVIDRIPLPGLRDALAPRLADLRALEAATVSPGRG